MCKSNTPALACIVCLALLAASCTGTPAPAAGVGLDATATATPSVTLDESGVRAATALVAALTARRIEHNAALRSRQEAMAGGGAITSLPQASPDEVAAFARELKLEPGRVELARARITELLILDRVRAERAKSLEFRKKHLESLERATAAASNDAEREYFSEMAREVRANIARAQQVEREETDRLAPEMALLRANAAALGIVLSAAPEPSAPAMDSDSDASSSAESDNALKDENDMPTEPEAAVTNTDDPAANPGH